MANQIVREQVESKIQLIAEVDETIKSVCKRIKEDDFCPGECAGVVKALAQLVIARALF